MNSENICRTEHGDWTGPHLREPSCPQADSSVVVASAGPTPMQLVERALESGRHPEQLKALMDLAERHAAEVSRRQFIEAMAGFRSEAIEIKKTREVGYANKNNTTTSYRHADLGDICTAIVPRLSEHGLSHRWETEQHDNGSIFVTCILTHVGGHSERSRLMAKPDVSGGKNAIQAVGSTITYLERYTLLSVTGLAASGQDDDGEGSRDEFINENQQAELLAVAEEEFGADRSRALVSLAKRYFGIGTGDWHRIPANRYTDAIRQLRDFKNRNTTIE